MGGDSSASGGDTGGGGAGSGTTASTGGRTDGGTSSSGTGMTSTGGESSEDGGAEHGGEGTTIGGGGGSSDSGGPGSAGNGDLVAQGVRWVGRVSAAESTRFAWSGTGFIARFSGTGISATLTNAEGYLFQIVIDGAPSPAFLAKRGEMAYPLATGLTPGEHVVELYRQTEGRYGDSELENGVSRNFRTVV